MNHGWKYITSDECFSSITPKSKIEKKYYSEGHLIPIISQEEEFISGYWDNYSDITPHERPIVIFGDHSRVLKYIDFDFVVGADGVKILLPNESIDAKFLYYYLKWKDVPSLGYSRHFKLLKDYNYLCPPIIRQAEIVSELDKINELIGVKRSQLKDLDALAQSLFYETFGEPIAPPKGWNTKVWSDLFDTILGKMLDKNKQIETDIQLPYLANQNVQWGYFDLSKLNTMSFTQNEVAKFRLKEGDILICEGGESGRCAIWKGADYTILFQKAIHRARIKDRNIINPYFVRFWLEIFKKNDGLKNHLTKATIEHLTGAKLKTVNVPVPPIALQEQFAERIEAIEEQKRRVEASIADLKTLLASRMDYWFND